MQQLGDISHLTSPCFPPAAYVQQLGDILHLLTSPSLPATAYVQQLGDLLEEKMDALARFRERLAVYRSQLAEEELISRNIKPTQRR